MSTPQQMTVSVTGATGFVGRYVVRALLGQGHAVRALVRDPAKASSVLPSDGVTRVVGDVFESAAVRDLVDGADAVVHTIGIRREVPPEITFARLHTEATRRVLDAAVGQGVRRWVQVSALGVRPGAPAAYYRSKYASEQLVRGSGLEWTILRPSLIHGHDGELIGMIRDWSLGRAAPRFFIPYFTRPEFGEGSPPKPPTLVSPMIAPVAVEDVAAMACAAIERSEAVGEIYPLAGPDEIDWPTLLSTVRDAIPLADERKKIIGVPAHAALGMAHAAGALGLSQALPFGTSEPVMAMEDSVASTVKAREHLGFEPRPFASTVAAYADRI
ncbi:MAG: NAD(P)H-binding protein [Planctomycetota bacterium]